MSDMTNAITTKCVVGAAGLALLQSASAAIVFDGSDTDGRSASASFEIVGGDLQVTLTNLGAKPTANNWDGSYALSGLFFNYSGSGSFSVGSASVSGGIIGTLPAGKTIGSYWAFDKGLTGAPDGATDGLRAAGFGVGGGSSAGNLGPAGSNTKVGGLDGAILGWDNIAGGNASLKLPLVYNAVVFTLTGSDLTSLKASDFSNVTFQYGTTFTETHFEAGFHDAREFRQVGEASSVPEPSTYITGLGALGILGLYGRRSRKPGAAC